MTVIDCRGLTAVPSFRRRAEHARDFRSARPPRPRLLEHGVRPAPDASGRPRCLRRALAHRGRPRRRPARHPCRRRPRAPAAHPGRVAAARLRWRRPRTGPGLRPARPRTAARPGRRLPRGRRTADGASAGARPAALGGARPARRGRGLLRRALQVPPRPRRRAARAAARRGRPRPRGRARTGTTRGRARTARTAVGRAQTARHAPGPGPGRPVGHGPGRGHRRLPRRVHPADAPRLRARRTGQRHPPHRRGRPGHRRGAPGAQDGRRHRQRRPHRGRRRCAAPLARRTRRRLRGRRAACPDPGLPAPPAHRAATRQPAFRLSDTASRGRAGPARPARRGAHRDGPQQGRGPRPGGRCRRAARRPRAGPRPPARRSAGRAGRAAVVRHPGDERAAARGGAAAGRPGADRGLPAGPARARPVAGGRRLHVPRACALRAGRRRGGGAGPRPVRARGDGRGGGAARGVRPLTEPGARPSGRTPGPRPPCRFVRRFHHRAVGDLTLAREGLDMAAEPGLARTVHTIRTRLGPRGGPVPARLLGRRPRAVEPPWPLSARGGIRA
ncbi:hypothetical protein SGPA1_41041 [Streptomyces misionensis JCM 4497]